MGDVTGSRAKIESAAENFLRFNDADTPGLRCAATADDNCDATSLTDRLNRSQLKRCRLGKRLTTMSLIMPAALITLVAAAGIYWYDDVQQKRNRLLQWQSFAPEWRCLLISQLRQPERRIRGPLSHQFRFYLVIAG